MLIDLRNVKMENITFNEQINLFLERKGHEILRYAYAGFNLHTHHYSCVRKSKSTYACRVSEAMKGKFAVLNWVLEQISHRLKVIPNLFFHNINNLTWYIFKRHRNSKGKRKHSLETMNQRGSFSQNILKSNLFWLGHFLALIFWV